MSHEHDYAGTLVRLYRAGDSTQAVHAQCVWLVVGDDGCWRGVVRVAGAGRRWPAEAPAVVSLSEGRGDWLLAPADVSGLGPDTLEVRGRRPPLAFADFSDFLGALAHEIDMLGAGADAEVAAGSYARLREVLAAVGRTTG